MPAGAYGRYVPSGHLVYLHRGTMFAAPMDKGRLELTGPAVPILEDVNFYDGTGAAGYAFSQTGMFLYAATNPEQEMRPLIMIDGAGKTTTVPLPKARYAHPRVSPDGSRLAVDVTDASGTHIWIYEFATERFSKFPFPYGNTERPIWTSDSAYIIFVTDATAHPGIYALRADGSGKELGLEQGTGLIPSSYSGAVGRFTYWKRSTIFTKELPGDAMKPGPQFRDLVADTPVLSPDGRWISYVSAPVGLPEVFVRPFKREGGPWQVSAGGGFHVWSPKGHEIFFRGKPEAKIMVASYTVSGDSFSPQRPRVWSETKIESFDLMPDGKRVIAIPAIEQKPITQAVVLLNFGDELRRRVPPGK